MSADIRYRRPDGEHDDHEHGRHDGHAGPSGHGPTRSPRRPWLLLVTLLVAGLVAAGCGDDDDNADASDDVDNAVEDVAESAGARTVAEALRTTLVAEDLNDDEHPRDVAVIEEAVADLPGEPEVTGIEDTDGDGQDDDGNVEVHVDDEVACVSIAANGEVDSTGGTC